MTKETYIAKTTEWKQAYKIHSQLIRDTRSEFTKAQQELSKIKLFTRDFWVQHSVVEGYRTKLHNYRSQATSMIEDRQRSKAEAAARM